MLLAGLFYIFIPLLFITVIAFKRHSSILNWALTMLSYGLVIAFLWATARWEIVSIYFRTLFPILYLIAGAFGFKKIKKTKVPQSKTAIVLVIGLHLMLIIFMSVLSWFTFRGYPKPDNTIELESPLRGGRYIVLHGGSSPFINGHFHVDPQNYALDIVGLNTLGMRSSSISGGRVLEQYAIFGDPVYCPCAGTVVVAVDQYDDMVPPGTDTENLAGNHVLIECDGVEILLAHLKKGSVAVREGDIVTTNTVLGKVGNTGNTSEPHLHIHAEKGGEPNTILNGTAVPFTINEHYLVRGNILKNEK